MVVKSMWERSNFTRFLLRIQEKRIAAETAGNINPTFGSGTNSELTVQRWFKKFRGSNEISENVLHMPAGRQLEKRP